MTDDKIYHLTAELQENINLLAKAIFELDKRLKNIEEEFIK